MQERRDHIPVAVQRAVREESGYACAVPACGRTSALELAHIVPWSKTKDDSFDNLILLCAGHHDDYDKGRIPKASIVVFKLNLSVVNHRYSEVERRVLEKFLADSAKAGAEVSMSNGFQIMMSHAVRDGLVTEHIVSGIARLQGGGIGFMVPGDGPGTGPIVPEPESMTPTLVTYRLTPEGAAWLRRYGAAEMIDDASD